MNKFFVKLKRILALGLIAVFTIFPSAIAEEGEYVVKNAEETELLQAFEIFEGSKTDFSKNLTRGDFAKLYTKMINGTAEYITDEVKFGDVSNESKIFGSVAFMSSMGYMTGHSDGTFRPEGLISYDEAVSVVVKILGYGLKASAKGGYPTGYKVVANELGLLSGFKPKDNNAITLDEASVLIYNSLFTAISEQTGFGDKTSYSSENGNTILNTYMDIDYTEGIMEDNSYSSLMGESHIKKGAVSVGGVVAENATSYAKSFLGYYVKMFYKTDESEDFVYLSVISNKNSTITVEAEDIKPSSTLTRLEYKEGKNKSGKYAKIKTDAYYIKNGEAVKMLTNADIKPKNGSVTLIDYDGNKIYDAIFINDYQIMVLSGKNATEDVLYGKYGEKISLEDFEDISVVDKLGLEANISSIKEYDVIAVFKGSKTAKIEICTDVVVSTLSKITDEDYIINETEHKLSPEYKASGLKLPEVGGMGTFYFGKSGVLAYYEKAESKDVAVAVAMTKKTSSFDDEIPRVKLYATDGKFKEFEFEDKVNFSGKIIKAEDIYSQEGLFNSNGDFIRQIVMYEIGETGEIKAFDTCDKNRGDDGKLQSASAMRSYRYCNPGTDAIGPQNTISGEDNRALFVYNTYCFKLPDDVNAERFYSVSKGALPYNHDTVISNAQAYFTNADSKKSGICDVLTVQITVKRDGGSGWNNRCTVVEGISKGVNSEGDTCEILSGYKDGKLVDFYAMDGVKINGIDTGDVLQITVNSQNEITQYRKVYSARLDTNCVFWAQNHKDDGKLSMFYNIENPDEVDSIDYYATKDIVTNIKNYGSRTEGTLNTDKGSYYATGTVTYKNGNFITVLGDDGNEYNFRMNENEYVFYATNAVRFNRESETVEAIKAATINVDDRVSVVTEAYSVMNILVIE